MRKCNKCGRLRPPAEFYRRRGGDGLQRSCKDCHSALIAAAREQRPEHYAAAAARASRRRRYGLSDGDYRALLEAQAGACYLCAHRPAVGDVALCVDHDAGTGEVRGLLCRECNKGLGFLRHSSAVLRAAAAYLDDPPARRVLDRANTAQTA